jgi:hypothetical protein
VVSFFCNKINKGKEKTMQEQEKSLKNFIGKMCQLCTDDVKVAKRVDRSNSLNYDYEVEIPDSEFAMDEDDFNNPEDRMEFAFLFEKLDCVDSEKANRCKDLVNLCAFYGYKNKYNTVDYDGKINEIETKVQTNPIPEIDNELPITVARAGWK